MELVECVFVRTIQFWESAPCGQIVFRLPVRASDLAIQYVINFEYPLYPYIYKNRQSNWISFLIRFNSRKRTQTFRNVFFTELCFFLSIYIVQSRVHWMWILVDKPLPTLLQFRLPSAARTATH